MANVLESTGKTTLNYLDYLGSLNIQLWATLRALRTALPLVGNRHRWRAAVHQMLEIGVNALPMVSLLAMCSGFILAMQGALSCGVSELCAPSRIWSQSASRVRWDRCLRQSL